MTELADSLEGWRAAALERLAAVMLAAPDARVPAYPEWSVRDLAVHVVRVHANARSVLVEAALERPRPELPVGPEDEPAVLARAVLDAGRDALVALEACTAERVWTPVGPRPPAFWARRLLREAVLHAFDAQQADGQPVPPPDPVGSVLVQEFLDTDLVRAWGADPPRAAPGPVALQAGEHTWLVDLGARTVGSGDPGPASVAGPPGALWLWLMRRGGVADRLVVTDGDGSVAAFERLLDGLGRPTG